MKRWLKDWNTKCLCDTVLMVETEPDWHPDCLNFSRRFRLKQPLQGNITRHRGVGTNCCRFGCLIYRQTLSIIQGLPKTYKCLETVLQITVLTHYRLMRIFGSNTRRLIQKMFMRLRLTCSIKIPSEDFEWWWSERVRNISWQSPDPLQVSGPRSSRRCEQIFMDRWATLFWCVTVNWRRAAETLWLETRYNHHYLYICEIFYVFWILDSVWPPWSTSEVRLLQSADLIQTSEVEFVSF